MAGSGVLHAGAMAYAVATDPQFRLPRRPVLCDGLVLLPMPDGLLVEGAPSRQVLRGAAARDLLPRLLPHLDGTHDLAGLATLAGCREATVRTALSLLYTCGLLADAPATAAPPQVPPDAVTFLSRGIDATRVNTSGVEACLRLVSGSVRITGGHAASGRIAALLRQTGLGRVDVAEGRSDVEPGGADLVVGLVEDACRDELLALDAACAAVGTPLLLAHVSRDELTVGPYVSREFTGCTACWLAQEGVAVAPAGPPTPDEPPDPAVLDLFASLVVAEVVALLGRATTSWATAGAQRLDPLRLASTHTPFAPVPGCRSCDPSDEHGPVLPVPTAVAYEASVAFPPRRLVNPKDHQHHYRAGNLELQREAKTYPSCARVALPGAAQAASPTGRWRDGVLTGAPAPAEPDLARLATLLQRVGGRRQEGRQPPGKVARWAPTGGNLGSPQVYVLTDGLAGLPAGAYHYVAPEHALAVLPAPPAGTAGAAADGTALVLTGALVRVARKYQTFAYRVVHLDAGVAVAQAAITAAGLGLAVESLEVWDDAGLARMLLLDADSEPVTAVLALRPGPTTAALDPSPEVSA